MAKGVRIPLHELNIMLSYYKREVQSKQRMQIYEELAAQFEGKYHVASIGQAIQRFMPTTDLAEALLQKKAFRLASRIARKANVTEAIDVLSRPNIGVLAPIKKVEGGGGFVLSISMDSCGAVAVGAKLNGSQEPPQLAPPPAYLSAGDSDPGVIITSHRVEEVDRADEAPESSPAPLKKPDGVIAKALERAKAKLEAAKNADGVVRQRRDRRSRSQSRQHQGVEGVQGADGNAEG